MAKVHEGQIIRVPCTVTPGPFSDEPIVTFSTTTGEVSGFVSQETLIEESGGRNYLRGIVRAIHGNEVEVLIKGSFFTTNGLATVPETMVAAA